MVLSALEKEDKQAFLFELMLVAAFKRNPRILTPDVKRTMKQDYNAAAHAVSRLKIAKVPFRNLLNAVLKLQKPEQIEEQVKAFLKAMRAAKQKIVHNPQITRFDKKLLTHWIRYVKKGNDKDLLELQRMAGSLSNSFIKDVFTPKAENPNEAKKSVQRLVQKLVRRSGDKLTIDEAQELRKKKPALYKEYLKKRKAYLQISKNKLMQMVRKYEKGLMPIVEAKQALSHGGYVDFLPEGLSGHVLVGEHGKLYTLGGHLINGVPTGKSTWNPKYIDSENNTYCLTAHNPNGDQRYYRMDYRKQKNIEKFEKVSDLIDNIKTIRRKWEHDLMASRLTPRKICAAIIEIVFLTAARVGTIEKQHTGISTLLSKNIKIKGNVIVFDYYGKKGIHQKHIIKATTPQAKALLPLLEQLKEDKSPNDLVFTWESKWIMSARINKYLKGIGSPVTIHKIRTLRGTLLASKLLDPEAVKGKSDNVINKYVKETLQKVGALLGHMSGDKVTAMTAIKYYILPSVLVDFYKKTKTIPSASIEKAIELNSF